MIHVANGKSFTQEYCKLSSMLVVVTLFFKRPWHSSSCSRCMTPLSAKGSFLCATKESMHYRASYVWREHLLTSPGTLLLKILCMWRNTIDMLSNRFERSPDELLRVEHLIPSLASESRIIASLCCGLLKLSSPQGDPCSFSMIVVLAAQAVSNKLSILTSTALRAPW